MSESPDDRPSDARVDVVAAAPRIADLEIFTVPEAAAFLRVSRQQIYNLINAGLLKSVIVGERTRVRRTDIDAYLQRPAS